MTTIGSQSRTIFGGRCLVSVNGNLLGMADRYSAKWGYGIGKKPVLGAYIKAYMTSSLDGTLDIEGLYTTDNPVYVLAQYANFVQGGDLPPTTVTVQEFDTATPTSGNVLQTFTGRMSPWQRDGQADEFSTYSFTLELNAEPIITGTPL